MNTLANSATIDLGLIFDYVTLIAVSTYAAWLLYIVVFKTTDQNDGDRPSRTIREQLRAQRDGDPSFFGSSLFGIRDLQSVHAFFASLCAPLFHTKRSLHGQRVFRRV